MFEDENRDHLWLRTENHSQTNTYTSKKKKIKNKKNKGRRSWEQLLNGILPPSSIKGLPTDKNV
jgi:hypothetical protein